MKNVHLLPTDKPSRLGYLTKKGKEVFKDLRLFDKPMPNILDSENQHIYITSDEEIKPNVFALINGVLCKTEIKEGKIVSRQLRGGATMDICKTEYLQILLTTDQDLIKDGVQAIDDEFLEWFVKNPSCEFVEVQKWASLAECGYSYHITIPQEEAKPIHQQIIDLAGGEERCKELLGIKPKQETLENGSIFKNKKWYSENGTVYNEADDSVRIALVFDNGSYMNLPIEIANKISQLLNN